MAHKPPRKPAKPAKAKAKAKPRKSVPSRDGLAKFARSVKAL